MSNEVIIIAVSNEPSLYNMDCESYKHKNRKHDAWSRVAAVVGLPGKYVFFNVIHICGIIAANCCYDFLSVR